MEIRNDYGLSDYLVYSNIERVSQSITDIRNANQSKILNYNNPVLNRRWQYFYGKYDIHLRRLSVTQCSRGYNLAWSIGLGI